MVHILILTSIANSNLAGFAALKDIKKFEKCPRQTKSLNNFIIFSAKAITWGRFFGRNNEVT